MTRIETIPGNFNTGVTMADLPIPRSGLLYWVDAASVTLSPEGEITAGETALASLIDVNSDDEYLPADRDHNFRDYIGTVQIARYISESHNNVLRRGYPLPADAFQAKDAITFFALLLSPTADDQLETNAPFFSYYSPTDGTVGSEQLLVEMGVRDVGTLRFIARHSDPSESAVILTTDAAPGTWVAVIAEIDYTANKITLEALGSTASVALGDLPVTGASNYPANSELRMLARGDTYPDSFTSKWKLAGQYDKLLSSREKSLLKTYLIAQRDRLSA